MASIIPRPSIPLNLRSAAHTFGEHEPSRDKPPPCHFVRGKRPHRGRVADQGKQSPGGEDRPSRPRFARFRREARPNGRGGNPMPPRPSPGGVHPGGSQPGRRRATRNCPLRVNPKRERRRDHQKHHPYAWILGSLLGNLREHPGEAMAHEEEADQAHEETDHFKAPLAVVPARPQSPLRARLQNQPGSRWARTPQGSPPGPPLPAFSCPRRSGS